jgi:hypothetical protein
MEIAVNLDMHYRERIWYSTGPRNETSRECRPRYRNRSSQTLHNLPTQMREHATRRIKKTGVENGSSATGPARAR